ncbi:hypothetical protein MVES1_000215 [Malassezia vespertilionis]|uniref:BZIP domain-containing protein n=1 Tax=Malassezia vespertilionis TaxID=2020962 RepID=A0A2N1JFZ2_9BASI|nr:uncharacterized protein MVES1_000215 [Malassezia vespertilionis]PKI85463.1 hypothetical protein MVES_000205 [Malassezia vespertilionis]WFD04890.1 hypothetical protein MVES1_000215 [Malassezia vespertilionis]
MDTTHARANFSPLAGDAVPGTADAACAFDSFIHAELCACPSGESEAEPEFGFAPLCGAPTHKEHTESGNPIALTRGAYAFPNAPPLWDGAPTSAREGTGSMKQEPDRDPLALVFKQGQKPDVQAAWYSSEAPSNTAALVLDHADKRRKVSVGAESAPDDDMLVQPAEHIQLKSERKASGLRRPRPSASQTTEAGQPFPVIDTSAKHSSLFVPPDTSGLTKREARLVKNRAAAFLSRQRKREQFDELSGKCRILARLSWHLWDALAHTGDAQAMLGNAHGTQTDRVLQGTHLGKKLASEPDEMRAMLHQLLTHQDAFCLEQTELRESTPRQSARPNSECELSAQLYDAQAECAALRARVATLEREKMGAKAEQGSSATLFFQLVDQLLGPRDHHGSVQLQLAQRNHALLCTLGSEPPLDCDGSSDTSMPSLSSTSSLSSAASSGAKRARRVLACCSAPARPAALDAAGLHPLYLDAWAEQHAKQVLGPHHTLPEPAIDALHLQLHGTDLQHTCFLIASWENDGSEAPRLSLYVRREKQAQPGAAAVRRVADTIQDALHLLGHEMEADGADVPLRAALKSEPRILSVPLPP